MQLKRRSVLEMILFFVIFTFMYAIALLEQSLTKFYTGILSAAVVYLIYYLGFKKELLGKLFNPIINSIVRFRQNQIKNDKVYKAFLKRVADSIHSEFHHIFTDEFYEIGKELIKAIDKVSEE